MVRQITITEYNRSKSAGNAGPTYRLEPATVAAMRSLCPEWRGWHWQRNQYPDAPEPFIVLVPVNIVPDWTR